MEILKFPAKSLTERSVDVDLNDQETITFLLDFLGFFLTLQGRAIGLACPQVGRNIRAFVALGDIYINPVVLDKSRGTYETFEGCMSLETGKTYKVRRHKNLLLKWYDVEGKVQRGRFEGREAQVIQHEYDHLEGKLLNQNG